MAGDRASAGLTGMSDGWACFEDRVEPRVLAAFGNRRSDMDVEDILVVISYASDTAAQMARERLKTLSVEDYIGLDLATYLTKDLHGKVKVEHADHHTGIRGRFGRQNREGAIDPAIVEEVTQAVQPGGAALVLLVHGVTPERVVPEIVKYGGTVIKTSLPADREQLLKEAFARQLTSEEIAAELNR